MKMAHTPSHQDQPDNLLSPVAPSVPPVNRPIQHHETNPPPPDSTGQEGHMASKNTAVFGIYKSVAQAERAVDALTAVGFANNDISVLLTDAQTSHDFAHEKNTKAPEGTAAGATTGGIIGGTLGLLAGIGTLAIPGIGPLIAAGPIIAALAGVGAGGAAGGIIGALAGLGIPEYEAKRYEGRVKDGGVLLSVHCDTSKEIDRAKELLKNTGGEDISSTSEAASPQQYAR